jgi:hypothetical protein
MRDTEVINGSLAAAVLPAFTGFAGEVPVAGIVSVCLAQADKKRSSDNNGVRKK